MMNIMLRIFLGKNFFKIRSFIVDSLSYIVTFTKFKLSISTFSTNN